MTDSDFEREYRQNRFKVKCIFPAVLGGFGFLELILCGLLFAGSSFGIALFAGMVGSCLLTLAVTGLARAFKEVKERP